MLINKIFNRDHFFLAEAGSEIENMSSFAVFDGHGGVKFVSALLYEI